MSGPAETPPRVSVVIVSWNTRELLRACLESLAAGGDELEVIVVDNGSADGSDAMVRERFPAVRLVVNETNRGFGKAVNQGFAASRAEYVLLLNSDTRVGEDAIPTCARFLDEHGDVAVVGCRLRYDDGRIQSSCFRFPSLLGSLLKSLYLSQLFPESGFLNWDRYGHREWDTPRQVDCVMGSFFLIRRTAVRDTPLLDEGYYMYGEETDLCYRMKRAGWKTMFLPDVEVVHHHGGSSTKTARLAAWSAAAVHRGNLRFVYKWRGPAAGWAANALVAAGIAVRAPAWLALDLVQGWRDGKLSARRILKARCLGFHLSALFRPHRLGESWRGPEAEGAVGASQG